MFNDWCYYLMVFGISTIMLFVYRLNLGPFLVILNILGFVGIMVHEISHYTLCKLLGVPVEHIGVRYRSRITGEASPHGWVTPKETYRMSFLQALLVGISPLFISTWLIMACFDVFNISGLNEGIYIGVGFLIVSLFIGSAPSTADFRFCYNGFKRSPIYSLYQLFLLAISILTIVLLINGLKILLPIEFMQYLFQFFLVGFTYFLYKYSFRVLNNVFQKLNHSKRFNLRLLTRKRHRPVKARKLGIEEPHW
jgi:hypothetical protein